MSVNMEHAGARPIANRKIMDVIKKQRKQWQLYLIILLPLLYVLVFSYGPMYGIQIAFKDFSPAKGIWGSPWIGFRQFIRFFNDYNFITVMKNTLIISISGLVLGFPAPILLALGLNELTSIKYKKVIQSVTYAPNFISTVVMVGMLMQMLDPRTGPINQFLAAIGSKPVSFMAEPKLFVPIYILSDIWQFTGFGAVIYIAALSGVSPELYEAAIIDGASKPQRIWHIDIPGILPTIIIMLILSIGSLINVGFEKIYLMQNPLNLDASDIIATYVYRMGLQQMQYSYASAIGLFSSVINFVLLGLANTFAQKLGQASLW